MLVLLTTGGRYQEPWPRELPLPAVTMERYSEYSYLVVVSIVVTC